jgi:light-regulated signal transduction histidine kinase (bacteriophytochrome)
VQVGELLVIEANPVQMRQLLQNLIVNGIKCHQEEITPQFSVTRRFELLTLGDRTVAVLVIVDNGIGFEEFRPVISNWTELVGLPSEMKPLWGWGYGWRGRFEQY